MNNFNAQLQSIAIAITPVISANEVKKATKLEFLAIEAKQSEGNRYKEYVGNALKVDYYSQFRDEVPHYKAISDLYNFFLNSDISLEFPLAGKDCVDTAKKVYAQFISDIPF